jgi:hypothetical protein
VELSDNAKYEIKGVGTSSFQLEFGKPLRMSDVFYVLGLKKNLLSISAMEDRGYEVSLLGGHVFVWTRRSSIDLVGVIGFHFGGIYRLNREPTHALVHESDSICKIWHRILGQLHYWDFPLLTTIVTCLPEFGAEH